MATPSERNLVSITAAAEHLDVHPITIRRWISASRIRAYRVGPRLLKVDLNEIDSQLAPIPTAGGGQVA